MTGARGIGPAAPVWVVEGSDVVLYVGGVERARWDNSEAHWKIANIRDTGAGAAGIAVLAGGVRLVQSAAAQLEANNTAAPGVGILVRYDGSLERVYAGASGSGPGGGTERALYIDPGA